MRITYLCVILAAASGLFAQAQNNNPSSQDRQFVDKAAQLNMTEVHTAKLAEQQAQSQAVKDFAQTLERDHSDSYQKLSALGRQDGFTVPTAIDSQHQREVEPLEKLTGASFDQKFKPNQINAHQQAINWVQNTQHSLQNRDLTNYASQLLETLQKHLQMAKTLNTNPINNTSSSTPQPGTTANAVTAATPAANSNGNASLVTNSGVAERSDSTGNSSTLTAGQQKVEYGTVTAYTPGQRLELKVRGRLGRHAYNLNSVALQNQMPNLKVGDQVSVTEMIDQNGRRAISVSRQ